MPKSGGIADKHGNRYEARWAVRQALLFLAGQAHSVQVEGLGEDEPGIDIWVVSRDQDVREGHQCKRQNGMRGNWSLAGLDRRNVLRHIKVQLVNSPDNRYVFVSSDKATVLANLAETARLCSGGPADFIQEVESTRDRLESFSDFCDRLDLDLDPESESDQQMVFDLLRRTSVKSRDESISTQRDDREFAERWVSGDGDAILELLQTWLLQDESLRRTIQAREIADYLISRGHQPRTIAHDTRLWPAVQRLQQDFKRSLSNHLAGGELIPRAETEQIYSSLADDVDTRLHIVHGAPGVGKSGVLFELVMRLEEGRVPYLPIRLDREPPRASPRTFGRDVLDLPESPARCLEELADDRAAVLILDQLDAIRWTSSHSAEAWATTRKVITEALNSESRLHVVLCCRSGRSTWIVIRRSRPG